MLIHETGPTIELVRRRSSISIGPTLNQHFKSTGKSGWVSHLLWDTSHSVCRIPQNMIHPPTVGWMLGKRLRLRLYISESDICICEILTSKVDPRTENKNYNGRRPVTWNLLSPVILCVLWKHKRRPKVDVMSGQRRRRCANINSVLVQRPVPTEVWVL